MSVRIDRGSILDFDGDTIVNPANSFLMHGAGLAKIIKLAAIFPEGSTQISPRGRAWEREQRAHPLIATGNVGVTSAGELPYKGIIHAVGPIYNDGHFMEPALLGSVHARACTAARARGWASIAFPAISCDISGYPVDEAAAIAVNYTSTYSRYYGMDITFYPFVHAAAFQSALDRQEAFR